MALLIATTAFGLGRRC